MIEDGRVRRFGVLLVSIGWLASPAPLLAGEVDGAGATQTARLLPSTVLDVLRLPYDIVGDADGNGRFDSGDVVYVQEILRHDEAPAAVLADVARPCNGRLEALDGKRLLGALLAGRTGIEVRSHCHGTLIGETWQAPDRRPPPPPLVALDDLFVRIARQVPGFGGLYLDAERNLRVLLREPSETNRVAAIEAIEAIFGPERFAGANVVAVPADHDFITLKGWKDRAEPLLGVAGVVSVDADERANRLRVGIDGETRRQGIENRLGRLGIPLEAVEVDVVEPYEFENHVLLPYLQKKRRPLIAGAEINSTVSTCSLGFLAKWYGQARGIITASHCAPNPGSPSIADPSPGTAFSQIAEQVGIEAIDPQWGCDWGDRCRQSDAIFIALDQGVTGRLGRVGRHVHAYPYTFGYTITGKAVAVSGDIAHKIGRSTGDTAGEVEATCAGYTISGESIGWPGSYTLVCQNSYEADSAKGDSGGPVLRVTNAPNDEAQLLGIHVVRKVSPIDSESIYTPIGNIEAEIGPLLVATGNEPPEIVITDPQDGAKIGPGAFPTVELQAQVFDFEGGGDCCEVDWLSSKDGPLGTTPWIGGMSGQTATLGGGQGFRAITATAIDANGATAWDTVVVSTGNSSPKIWIDWPPPGAVLYAGFPYVLQGSSFDNEEFQALECASLEWTASPQDGSFPVQGCSPQVSFSSTGIHSVTLTGEDPNGASGSATHVFAVLAPPANVGPSVVFTNPVNNAYVLPGQATPLKAIATDPDGQSPINYQWTASGGGITGQALLGSTSGASGAESTLSWTPADVVPGNCGASNVTITVIATDPDGQSGSGQIDLGVLHSPC